MSKRKSKAGAGPGEPAHRLHQPHPSGRSTQEITVDVRRGTIIDMDYAAAMVAVRTYLSLDDVRVIRIEEH